MCCRGRLAGVFFSKNTYPWSFFRVIATSKTQKNINEHVQISKNLKSQPAIHYHPSHSDWVQPFPRNQNTALVGRRPRNWRLGSCTFVERRRERSNHRYYELPLQSDKTLGVILPHTECLLARAACLAGGAFWQRGQARGHLRFKKEQGAP